jgi:protein-tyrosine-phosphatase
MKKYIFCFFAFFLFSQKNFSQDMTENLKKYCLNLSKDFEKISEERKILLRQIADYHSENIKKGKISQCTFICTHNSRRSQFAQVWAWIAAVFYDVKVHSFSGGTAVTACNERTVAALRRAGVRVEEIFQISAPVTVASNPRYQLAWSEKMSSVFLFSKKYDEESENPQKDYCAVMVCSAADKECPVVSGAEKRVFLPFDDPKSDDGTPYESESYDKTCQKIALEIFFLFSCIEKK